MIMIPRNPSKEGYQWYPSKASHTSILFQATWGNKQHYETCKRPLPTKSPRLQAAEPQERRGKAKETQIV